MFLPPPSAIGSYAISKILLESPISALHTPTKDIDSESAIIVRGIAVIRVIVPLIVIRSVSAHLNETWQRRIRNELDPDSSACRCGSAPRAYKKAE